jgi:hypothetical protein
VLSLLLLVVVVVLMCGRTEHSLNWYRFIGRILGKAMYEGILVDVAFAGFFLAKVTWVCIFLCGLINFVFVA